MVLSDDSNTPFKETREACADPIDDASATELRFRQNEIARQMARAAPEQAQVTARDENGVEFSYWPITECVDCGDDIPEARLALARIRCIHCQTLKEKKEKHYVAHGA